MIKGFYKKGDVLVEFVKIHGYVNASVNKTTKFVGHEKEGIFEIIEDFINKIEL